MTTADDKALEELCTLTMAKLNDLMTLLKSISRLTQGHDNNAHQLAEIGFVLADDLHNDIDVYVEENIGARYGS